MKHRYFGELACPRVGHVLDTILTDTRKAVVVLCGVEDGVVAIRWRWSCRWCRHGGKDIGAAIERRTLSPLEGPPEGVASSWKRCCFLVVTGAATIVGTRRTVDVVSTERRRCFVVIVNEGGRRRCFDRHHSKDQRKTSSAPEEGLVTVILV
ncbi:hypothetical protein PIB30_086398 [Stylosanthes scabra]|uniref:Uncharacterized protein n=1 Tax=Stylosanthes scabra TaxID=79078 RepID=A0ABU6QSM8_9FABA|nr:hypothetical protein [Stylosanthes scabra]